MESNIAGDFQTCINTLSADIGLLQGSGNAMFAGMKDFEDRLKQLENRPSSATTTTRDKFERPLLESKIISNIKPIKDDRSEYKVWMDKFVNAVSQFRTGSRTQLETILQEAIRGEPYDNVTKLDDKLSEDI